MSACRVSKDALATVQLGDDPQVQKTVTEVRAAVTLGSVPTNICGAQKIG
jgi:hypothetical protein